MRTRPIAVLAALLLLVSSASAQSLTRPLFRALPDLPVLDPRKYGAIPNDNNDDLAAIQAAVNAARDSGLAAQSGGVVLIPPGRWLVSQPIVLPRNGAVGDNVVHLVGVNPRACLIEGMASFPANRALVEWEASTSRVWHGRIAGLNLRCPPVAGTKAIWHKSNRAGGMGAGATITDVMNEWFQCDMEDLILEGTNQYNEVLIDLEVGNRCAVMRNIIGDPARVVQTYNTLLLRVPSQYNNTNPGHGEDSIGIGLCTLSHVYPMVRRGGWVRTFEGRMYGTTWDTAFDNGPRPGSGGYGYNFRNSFQCTLRSLMSEGGGGVSQFLFNNCRDFVCENFIAPVGAASGETAWSAGRTGIVAGTRVIPTRIANPALATPLANRVYTAQNGTVETPLTTGDTEPDWTQAAGAGQTINDNGITWRASDFPAAANGVEVQACENMVFNGHYMQPGSPAASGRLTKEIIIDSACRNVKFRDWTVRVTVSGGTFSGNTDAAAQITIDPAAAANFCYVEGEGVQSFNNWRIPYRLGQDQRQPTATATLDFPGVAAGGSQTLSVSVPGAAPGDAVQATPPSGFDARLTVHAYVSAGNTVTVRAGNPSAGEIDPASGTWRVTVIKP